MRVGGPSIIIEIIATPIPSTKLQILIATICTSSKRISHAGLAYLRSRPPGTALHARAPNDSLQEFTDHGPRVAILAKPNLIVKSRN
jgi:hypothetical protein